MKSLRKVTLAEVVAELPEIIEADGDESRFDLFICPLGFEDRALAVPKHLSLTGARVGRVVCLTYDTNTADNQANEPQLRELLAEVTDGMQVLSADSPELVNDLEAMLADTPCEGPPHVLLDISVATNRLIIRVLETLVKLDVHLTVAYAEAEQYFPTKEEFENESGSSAALSEGIGQVDVGIEHPGQHLDALPHLVLVFPGYSVERTRAALSALDPVLLNDRGDQVVWYIGAPRLSEDEWRQEAVERLYDLGEAGRRVVVSTFDYRATLQELDRIYVEYEGRRRMTLVPMGSKMQAVGVSLFCYLRPDVSALFATPTRYNAAHYSKGCKALWQLDLGPTSELRRRLDRVGTLELIDD